MLTFPYMETFWNNSLYEQHAMDSILQKVELGCILYLICYQILFVLL